MFNVLEIFAGLLLASLAIYYYLTANNNFWKNRGVPGPAPMVGFGNVYKLMVGKEAIPDFVSEIYEKYRNEPVVGAFLRTKPMLIIQEPNLIKNVLIKDFSKFANRGFLTADASDPLSQHLFSLEAKRWRPLRTQLSPVFTAGKLRGTFSLILECSKHLETYLDSLLEKGEPIEVREVMARFTTDVIGSCGFGLEMNSLSGGESEFRRIGKEIFTTRLVKILRVRLQQIAPLLSRLLNKMLPETEVTKVLRKITVDTIEYRRRNNIVRPDFMNILMELKEHPEKVGDIELSDDLLAAQAFVFFAAGFETSSTTISNSLYELAYNQDVQEKLRNEIREVEEKNDGEWTYETVKGMQYLDKVFQETLRKYPALPFLSREAVDDYTFQDSGLTITKGTLIWVPTFAIHRDENIYPDPEKFDPERFSDEMVQNRHPMYYLPFGHGPRNCIGARFAVYQTKIGLIKTIRNYKVETCEKTPTSFKYHPFAFILTPMADFYLKMTKIEN